LMEHQMDRLGGWTWAVPKELRNHLDQVYNLKLQYQALLP